MGAINHTQEVWVQVGVHRLQIRDISPDDSQAVVALHASVFGSQVDQAWFGWKYGARQDQGCGQAVGAWHEDQLIAFCGGVPRALLQHRNPVAGLQLADVMVHPNWRGILTRRGPFYFASHHFYSTRLGPEPEKPFQLAFGFGSQTHVTLATKVKLGWNAGRMRALRWDLAQSAQSRLKWHWVCDELQQNQGGFVDQLRSCWVTMQSTVGAYTVGIRDEHYLNWRYCHRPQDGSTGTAIKPRYRFFGLRKRWAAKPSGILVMDLNSQVPHWLDWIGDIGLIPTAATVAKVLARKAGASQLLAWSTPAVEAALDGTNISTRETCAWLGIPSNSNIIASDIPNLNWWLMGGDTDYL